MADISSPCVRNCCLNQEDVCLGCFRSLDEILQWRAVTDQQRQEIIRLAEARQIEHRLKYQKFMDSRRGRGEDR